MDSQLAQFAALSQKDKGPAFISLIPQIIALPDPASVLNDLHTLVDTVVNQESIGLVVGRQVLSELVKVLGEGAIRDVELCKRVVQDILNTTQPRIVSYEEQVRWSSVLDGFLRHIPKVNNLRFQLADLLEGEEEWSDAARVLMGISLDSGQRLVPSFSLSFPSYELSWTWSGQFQMQRNYRFMSASFVSSWRMKIPSKLRPTTIGQRSLSIQHKVARLSFNSSSAKLGLATMDGNSWRPPVGTTS